MRLINTSSLRMEEFGDSRSLPGYAILSHCWSADRDEVSYQDFHNQNFGQQSIGWRKISMCCELARQNGLEWAWVDTCCIDKTSSAELTEAINSMYTWYELSAVCYVFLPDVHAGPENVESNVQRTALFDSDDNDATGSLSKSRWFTRGWTLQELLAPARVEFYDIHYDSIGSKLELSAILAEITGIDRAYLDRKRSIREASIAARMSWASGRRTKRFEDIAYSLLGIFDVNMPLIYGEGDKAFMRLQLAIIAQSDDCTILAWDCNHEQTELCGTLASSPDHFIASHDIVDTQGLRSSWPGGFESTNRGLHYWYPLVGPEIIPSYLWPYSLRLRGLGDSHQIQLNCRDQTNKDLILHIARQENKW